MLTVPIRQWIVRSRLFLLVEKLAKIASSVLNAAIDFVIPLPSEIFIILSRILDQFLQVFGQILGRVEVEHVYVRSWRSKETVIGATVHDWDHVVSVNKKGATLFNYFEQPNIKLVLKSWRSNILRIFLYPRKLVEVVYEKIVEINLI